MTNKTKDEVEGEEVLEANAKNILLSIISQLGKGADLHRVTLPTFVLEPRSFLEKLTDFMSHPELIINVSKLATPEERIVAITKYSLSGWHIRPKGVRKPYNPVLGEYFRCHWKFENGTKCYFLAEQVSHHPPISAFVVASPDNNFIIQGDMRPKSKFYGTSAGSLLEGSCKITFLNHPGEEYIVTYPNLYAYGILFGKLTMDMGDISTITCKKTDLVSKMEFKTKGMFSGSYHVVCGKIKKLSTNDTLYEVNGHWTDKVNITPKNGSEELFLDIESMPLFPRTVKPIEEQGEFESIRLWQHVTSNLISNQIDPATEEKSKIEEAQRTRTKAREAQGEQWQHRFFNYANDTYTWKLESLSEDPQEANAQIEKLIFENQIE